MPTFTGINHLAMATGDMDATIRFWRDLLGMPLVAGLGRPGYRHYFLSISPTDMIAFFEWPGTRPLPQKDHGVPVSGPFAFDHVSFGVAGEDDLWEVKDRLAAAGFEPSEVVDHGFIKSVYAFDPNGIPIEFSASVPGTDPRRTPAMADSAPSGVTLEGPNPQPGHWPAPTPTSQDQRADYPGEGRELLRPERNAWKK
ncbi:catechol 2,3-dioxygenase-like lactoylglutathione lyase family enzyme [Desulfobaculum xiamenense]|uniref:Catechol 2,3-dioxygenase-like lactoylglutathione lyase family enzyme n=1 Tax=Desulfobaculum xiamenense TaxID=995050 RepID=A0A846QJD1_9BACT|nr:VOC family protein [Desulfobaculum xiamenense]NJB68976.1 catechol 2,3-dioxygenase-like lactoylglutathione lyase family enzyme [Desulfobaculum xiamenense]